MQLLGSPYYHFLLAPDDFIVKQQNPDQQINLLYKLDYLTNSRMDFANQDYKRMDQVYTLRLYTTITQFLREMTLFSQNNANWIEGQISNKAHINFLFTVFKSNQLAHFKKCITKDINDCDILIPPTLLEKLRNAKSVDDALKYSRRFHAAIANKHENDFKVFLKTYGQYYSTNNSVRSIPSGTMTGK